MFQRLDETLKLNALHSYTTLLYCGQEEIENIYYDNTYVKYTQIKSKLTEFKAIDKKWGILHFRYFNSIID